MPVGDRLRQLFGADRADSERDEPHEEPGSDGVATEGAPAQAAADNPTAPESSSPTDLVIAQGQELLGRCEGCSGYWTREVVRGQKPRTCPVCKREGPPDRNG